MTSSLYVIYNPEYRHRDRHKSFEVYKLVKGKYQLQDREPVWMPEIELGIGRVQGNLGGIVREWLAWHDAAGAPHPLPQELIRRLEVQLEQERRRTQQERQRAEELEQAIEEERLEKLQLLEQLRQLGMNLEQNN